MRERDFSRIALIKPSSLGDVIHALPVLHGLRKRYPKAHIAWVVNDSFAPLIAHHPDINEVITFDRQRYARFWRRPHALWDLRKFLATLRQKRFDLAIDLQGLFRSGLMSHATHAPVRIGFEEAREFAGLGYTHCIPDAPRDMHAIDRNYAVGAMLGLDVELPAIDFAVTQAEREVARELLGKPSGAGDVPIVAIFPGARWETKRWMANRFVETVDRLADQTQARIALFGGRDEIPLCESIAAGAKSSPMMLAGRTNLRGLVAVIAESAFVLCHDSGPMHIAAALGRPMLALLGPTNPQRTGPYRRPEAVMRLDLACSPCYLRSLSRCPHSHECMRGLTVDGVVERIVMELQAGAGAADSKNVSAQISRELYSES